MVRRLRFHRLGIKYRRANVAERLIHGVRQDVNHRRLLVTGQDQTAAAMLLQIANHGAEPFLLIPERRTRRRAGKLNPESARQRGGAFFDRARFQRQTVIRHGAGHRWRAFDDVQPIHRRLRIVNATLIGKIPRRAQARRAEK